MHNWPQLYAESLVDVSDVAEDIAKQQGGFYDIFGSWSCKNPLAEALTCGDLGDVAMRGHFCGCGDFSDCWRC
jgi:hypothetical protein